MLAPPVPPIMQSFSNQLPPQQQPMSIAQTFSALNQVAKHQNLAGLNGGGGGGGCAGSEDVFTLDRVNLKDAAETLDAEYRKDFDRFKNMNLVDSKDELDEIYCSIDSFNQPEALCSLLIGMYKQKYEDLYAKYEGLEAFTVFVLVGITSRKTFAEFKTAFCNSSGIVNNVVPPRTRTISRFALFKRKNFHSSGDGSVADTDTDGDARASKLTKKKHNNDKPTHPLYKTQMFINNRILFRFGEINSFLVPLEFAAIKSSLTAGDVKIYGQNQRSERGVILRTSVPILCRVSVRTLNNQTYHDIVDTDQILKFTNAGLGKDVTRFQSAVKKVPNQTSLVSLLPVSMTSPDIETVYNITSRFDFYTVGNTIVGRCFSEKTMVLLTADRRTFTETPVNETIGPNVIAALENYEAELEKCSKPDVSETTTADSE